jgi:hypothetical protein
VSHQSELRCSFCNKKQNDVRKLIAGPDVNICDECVEVCVDIMADATQAAAETYAPQSEASYKLNEGGRLRYGRCAICNLPLMLDEALAVKERGFLCAGCVDAIQAAIAEEARD